MELLSEVLPKEVVLGKLLGFDYSRVPIRRGVRNKRSGTQDEKCIWQNISHMCLGLYRGW